MRLRKFALTSEGDELSAPAKRNKKRLQTEMFEPKCRLFPSQKMIKSPSAIQGKQKFMRCSNLGGVTSVDNKCSKKSDNSFEEILEWIKNYGSADIDKLK